jgi:hypothetical protein
MANGYSVDINKLMDQSLADITGGPMTGIAPVGGVQPSLAGGMGYDQHVMQPGQGGYDLNASMPEGGGMEGFDWGGAMKGFSDFGSGLTSLAGAYNAYKQLGMMEDQFNFAKGAHNLNVSNQAAITNDQLRKQRSAAARQMGMKDGSKEFQQYVGEGTQVSGAPVG